MNKLRVSESVYATKDMLFEMKKKAALFSLGKNKLMVDIGFGEHKSPFKTKGLDFQEVRVYQPGDDIRLIDWKITAKHNKPYTKLYTDEKEQQIFIIADMRSHMQFATKGVFKSVLVAKSGAFISFLAENKNDKIGFCIIQDDKIECALPQMGKETVISFVEALDRAGTISLDAKEEMTLLQVLSKSEKFVRRGAMVFVISDFVDFDQECEAIIKRMSKKATCSLVHVYDEIEKKFPKGVLPITNGKDILFVDTKEAKFQKKYEQSYETFVATLKQIAQNERVGYLPLSTSEDFINQLAFYCKGGLI